MIYEGGKGIGEGMGDEGDGYIGSLPLIVSGR